MNGCAGNPLVQPLRNAGSLLITIFLRESATIYCACQERAAEVLEMSFNPVEHRVCFSFPERLAGSAWTEHIPFGMLLVDLVRPHVLVELGTFRGASYCAFCQAVQELRLDTRCYGIDNFEGDEHGGFYGPDIFADLKAHHDPRYAGFSQLIKSSFDDALPVFGDSTIDLLHIDGYHTYDAVKHDFDKWLPKLSDRGVVIFHDTAERGGDFGVWKFWDELKARYPHAEVYHGHGLGVIATGSFIPEGLRPLLELHEDLWPAVRTLFHELGVRIVAQETEQALRMQIDQMREEVSSSLQTLTQQHELRLASEVGRFEERLREAQNNFADELAALTQKHNSALSAAQSRVAALEDQLSAALWQLRWFESSRGVRVIKLARASRTVLQRKGPFSLMGHVVRWSVGKRGYHLSDIQIAPSPATYQQSASAAVSEVVRGQKLPAQTAFAGVTIVIPVFNALEYAKACLESVYRARCVTQSEVIIIDNGSRDDVRRWLETEAKQHPNLWYVSLASNLGFAKAVNLGIRNARGQYIVLLNSDTVVTSGWLDNLVQAADSQPEIGVVSPVTNYVGEGPQIDPDAIALPVAQVEQYAHKIQNRAGLIFPPERMAFFCVLIKRQVVNLLGGLSEAYGLGNFEDEDYNVRARMAGFKLAIARNAFVYHHGSKTFQTNKIDHTALMAANYVRYLEWLSGISSTYTPRIRRPKVANPEVSVVVRTLNRRDTLQIALTSLANQTFDEFEVVLVNDAGDDVSDLVESFSDRLTIQYVRHEERKGAAAGLNTGVASARGRYIAYLDDDDVVYPFHLESLWRAITDGDGTRQFVYSDYNRVLLNGRGQSATSVARVPLPTWEFNPQQLQVENQIAIHTYLHARECVDAVGGFDNRLSVLQDWDFLIRAAAKYTFYPTHRISCEYRFYLDQGNSLVRGRARSLEEMELIYSKYPTSNSIVQSERDASVEALHNQIAAVDKLHVQGKTGAIPEQQAFRKILGLVAGFPAES